jgi:integrase
MEKNNAPVNEGLPAKRMKNANGQGTIFPKYKNCTERKRQRYLASIHDLNGKRITRTFQSRKEAQEWLDTQKRARHFGQSTYSPHPKMTVEQFLTMAIEARRSRLSPETYRNYQGAARRISGEIGSHNASTLSPHAIEYMLGRLSEKGLGISTQKNAYAVLRMAYGYAVRMGDMPTNPVLKIDAPSGQINPTRHIPRQDFEKIYQTATLNPYSHARIEIGGMVGPRPCEVLGLLWSDIDWQEKTLRIERQLQRVSGKGLVFRDVKQKQARIIHLTSEQIDILHTHWEYQQMTKGQWACDEGLIFPNSRGRRQDAKADRKWWKSILTWAVVNPNYQLYQLRKTAYTQLGSLNAPIPNMLEYTGHANASTLYQYYAFATNEAKTQILEGIDRMRPKNLPGLDLEE